MKKVGQRGTLAGLAMIGLALAWATFDANEREGSDEVNVIDSSQARTARKKRSTSSPRSSHHSRSKSHAAGLLDHPRKDLDSQLVLSEEARPQYRVVQPGSVALSDTVLLNNSSSTRTGRSMKRKFTERESLKALRLGAHISDSLISLELALAAIDPDGVTLTTTSQRAEAIRSLAIESMDYAQIEVAYQFIEKGTPPEGIAESTYHWLSDELFIALRNQENVPSDLVQRLSDIASNSGQDTVLRDYAIQHLGHYHEESGNDLESIEKTLWKATSSKEGTIAGTALIALTNAMKEGRMVSSYDLQAKAVEILKGGYTAESKISALEALRGNQSEKITNLVHKLASDEKIHGALKIKATNL